MVPPKRTSIKSDLVSELHEPARINFKRRRVIIIVIYTISGIKAVLQDSSVKIADDEGVSPSSSVIHEFPVICFSPRVMYKILSKTAPN
jgi:hypothetical protein